MIQTYSKATQRATQAAQTALQLAEEIQHATQHLAASDPAKILRLSGYLAEQAARERQLQHVSDLLRYALHLMQDEVTTAHERAVVSGAIDKLPQPQANLPISLELERLGRGPNAFATCIAEVNVLCSMLEHSNRTARALLDEISSLSWRESSNS